MVVLLLALGLTGLVALLSKGFRPRSQPSKELVGEAARTNSAQISQPGSHAERGAPLSGLNHGATSSVVSTVQVNRAEIVSERIAQLEALARNDDTNSLNEILSELSNPDPDLRKAALEAVIQFGGRSAIPRLQELASETEDAGEKADLTGAIDFLSLPSLMDYQPAKPGGRKAAMNSAVTNRPGRNPFQNRPASQP